MPVTGSKPTYYNLSIRVKADGFSFIVTEGHSGDNLLCHHFTVSEGQEIHALLAEELQNDELRNYSFKRVRVIVYSDSTCIPQQEFVASDLTQLYNIVFPQIDETRCEVCYTHLPQLDIVEAFVLLRDIRQAITAVYPDATFTSASAVVLGRVATFCQRQQLPDNAVFAYTTPQQLFLFSIGRGRLQFANTFPLDQPRDSLFYLLSVWKTLELDARTHYCYVAGEDDSVEFLTQKARNYIKHVESMTLSIEA